MHDLHVRSLRQFAWMLVVVSPALCAMSLLTGEASLDTTLRYMAVVETGFVAIWLMSRRSFGDRYAEYLQFALTLVAAYGVVFSPTHESLPHKPYAMVAPMASFIYAVVAPVRPWLAFALAAGTAAFYAISLQLEPNALAVNPWGYAVLCSAMAWMGATFARNQRDLWRELEGARRGALDATRLKSEFLANMSHEIRTPMTAILGFAEEVELELERSAENASMRGALATIRRNGAHLLSLINDILDLSKIEAGKLEAVREPCAPLPIVVEVASLLRPQAASRGLTLETIVTGDIPEIIASDRMRLRQILINLIGNALKFTERGGVKLEIGSVHGEAGSRTLEITVVDTGAGIPADQVGRLFESFTQVQGSLTRAHQGAGLGLALSRRLARLMGGDIDVTTQLGVGSRFRLTLPLGPDYGVRMLSLSEAATLAAADPTPTLAVGSGPLAGRVLLVEDGADNQRLIGAVLGRVGLRVDCASDGERGSALALEAEAAGEPYDVILMDMQMPVLDGYAAVQRLRARGYAGPIIALTANAMAGDRERCLAIGCDDHATKPITRETLLRQIQTQLEKAARA